MNEINDTSFDKIGELLNRYYDLAFAKEGFIVDDPVSIPHSFSTKEDIEISGFLSASISWGNRKAIINSCKEMMRRMDNAPHDFIINAQESDYQKFQKYYYRTFQDIDAICFIDALHKIYKNHGGLEKVFTDGYNISSEDKIKNAIIHFRNIFFENEYPTRVGKHLANPQKGSAAKRINMFLRWMVRNDIYGIDFGLWKNISPADLIIPLDVHVGNTARKIGLTTSNANNWKTAEEITAYLRRLDSTDPVKYDYALFGISNSKFNIA